MNKKYPHRYDDIIDLPRFISKGRKKMSNYDRAAQFAPFDALDGYDEAMSETARTTDSELILSENELQILDQKFEIITRHLKDIGEVEITYFEPDQYKEGGIYQERKITIKRIDLSKRMIISTDNEKYYLDNISDIRNEFISRFLDGLE